MTEEKKYKIKDDDRNINLTEEHQLDETENINRTYISDIEGRSMNQDDGQYQGQYTAQSWPYNNQTCKLLLPGSIVYNFPSFSGLSRQIRIGCTTIQQCKYCDFFEGARMLVNINVFFCFTSTMASICINTSMQYQFAIGMS